MPRYCGGEIGDAPGALFSRALASASLQAAETCAWFSFKQATMRPPPGWTPGHSFSTSALQAARGPLSALCGSAARTAPDDDTSMLANAMSMPFIGTGRHDG